MRTESLEKMRWTPGPGVPKLPYEEFNALKEPPSVSWGFACEASEVNPLCKPHQKDIVAWKVRGGRRGCFASFGLGKSIIQLETLRLSTEKSGADRSLIVLPLNMRWDFEKDARLLGLETCFIQKQADAQPRGIHLTNYESVREAKVDPTAFDVISLDEASILRGTGGTKTFREFMARYEFSDRLRFVNTAVPDPNTFEELFAYAAFLGIMDIGQAKTRFCERDSEKADHLTLIPHKRYEFLEWVSSWGLFIWKPSDLGHSDEGYDLPPLRVEWHEIPSDHVRAFDQLDQNGQRKLVAEDAIGLSKAAKEKRVSMSARVEKLKEILSAEPEEHHLIWHDLEDERRALEKEIPGIVTIHGATPMGARENIIDDFQSGKIARLGAKPTMLGSGCNLQRSCHLATFLGVGFKFNDVIQAIHRLQRYLQRYDVTVNFIYTESEAPIRETLQRKWDEHDALVAEMSTLLRERGLAQRAIVGMNRSTGVTRREVRGKNFLAVYDDAVYDARRVESNSAGLIGSSFPFANQYEYSANWWDFGHTDDPAHFWAQMDYLIPEMFRGLMPGRCAIIHVKDRIVPGGISGLGFQTVYPFSDDCRTAMVKHGFAFLGRRTILTDVVRENNQTYRLGWSEQCKDGSRMGCGMNEYLMLFRKPQTDRSKGYADIPVLKSKDDYSRARWQLDASGFWRSSGDRFVSSLEIARLAKMPDGKRRLYRLWKKFCKSEVYDFEAHLRLCEEMEANDMLPSKFQLAPPHSWDDGAANDPGIWSDVVRMVTLNTRQAIEGKEQHLCPLPIDIVDRCILQCSMPGEVVWDPFAGLFTFPARAVALGRFGRGSDLNEGYWTDGVHHCRAAETGSPQMTMVDLLDAEMDESASEPAELMEASA